MHVPDPVFSNEGRIKEMKNNIIPDQKVKIVTALKEENLRLVSVQNQKVLAEFTQRTNQILSDKLSSLRPELTDSLEETRIHILQKMKSLIEEAQYDSRRKLDALEQKLTN